MVKNEVYLHGQILGTHSFLLKDGFLEPEAVKRWSMPKEEDIVECKVAAIDPYFKEETQAVAELCKKHGKPYVTIDCRHDTYLHKNSAINVVSKECTCYYLEQGNTLDDIYQWIGYHYFRRKGNDIWAKRTANEENEAVPSRSEKYLGSR